MILDENSPSSVDLLQPARSFDPQLAASGLSIVDWACSITTASAQEREQERLVKLERDFVGRLIEDYERTVANGLPATRALASLLEWASQECPRL